MRRLITAIGLVALALYLVFLAPYWVFVAGALCMALLCFWEYRVLVQAHSVSAPGFIAGAGGLLVFFWPHAKGSPLDLLAGLMLVMVLAFVVSLSNRDLREVMPEVACSLLGIFYTFTPWRFAIELRRESVHLLFFALALNWAGDSAAYYVGKAFGKRKLAPNVSPNKTWEGAIASVTGSLLFGIVYLHYVLPALTGWEVAAMSVIGNLAGQFGDLTESAVKRGARVKDSGNLLPGHGGVLDRLDSSLFALPVVYLIYRALSLFHN